MLSNRATCCPACGGEIHPVAGRCKHCKQDLVELRAKQALAEAAESAAPSAPAPATGTPPRGTLPAAPPPVIGPGTTPRPSPRPAAAPPRPSWWRRWPLAAAAAALFLLGLAAGMMLERRRGPATSDADDDPLSRAADPPDLTPEAIPTHPLPPMDPDPDLGGAPSGDPQPSAADVHDFVERLGARLCDKAIQCGLFPATNRDDCEAVVRTQPDPDAVAKIARGECTYDAVSAAACLRAVDRIDCTADTADSLLFSMSGSLVECERAFHCR